MRKGNEPQIVYDTKGRILAIGTGSDACAEHECGSAELMESLVGFGFNKKRDLALKLRAGKIKEVPDFMSSKRLQINLDKIVYGTAVEKGETCGVIGFLGRGRTGDISDLVNNNELSFGRRTESEDVAGAWDERSFGFKVKGQKLADKLEEFSLAVKGGGGVFAGTFVHGKDGRTVSGVCIARESLLRPEHRAEMKKAQADFEQAVRLEVLSRADELMSLTHGNAASRSKITHISARWKDAKEPTEVVYWVNAAYKVEMKKGDYTFEELRDWIVGGAPGRI